MAFTLSQTDYRRLLQEKKIDEFILRAEEDALKIDEEVVRIERALVNLQKKLMELNQRLTQTTDLAQIQMIEQEKKKIEQNEIALLKRELKDINNTRSLHSSILSRVKTEMKVDSIILKDVEKLVA